MYHVKRKGGKKLPVALSDNFENYELARGAIRNWVSLKNPEVRSIDRKAIGKYGFSIRKV